MQPEIWILQSLWYMLNEMKNLRPYLWLRLSAVFFYSHIQDFILVCDCPFWKAGPFKFLVTDLLWKDICAGKEWSQQQTCKLKRILRRVENLAKLVEKLLEVPLGLPHTKQKVNDYVRWLVIPVLLGFQRLKLVRYISFNNFPIHSINS